MLFTRGSSAKEIEAGIAVEGNGRQRANKASIRKRKTAICLFSTRWEVGGTTLKEDSEINPPRAARDHLQNLRFLDPFRPTPAQIAGDSSSRSNNRIVDPLSGALDGELRLEHALSRRVGVADRQCLRLYR